MDRDIDVPGMLKPAAAHGKLAEASAIFDEDIGKFQSQINAVSIRGTMKVVELTGDIVAFEEPERNTQIDVIYTNNTGSVLTVTVGNNNCHTPDGNPISIPVPIGGYAEVNFLNIEGIVFVRGL